MLLGYVEKEIKVFPILLDRANTDFSKSDDNLMICCSEGTANTKYELIKREIEELCELEQSVIVFSDDPRYSRFERITQYPFSKLENMPEEIRTTLYDRERKTTLHVYIDNLDGASKRQLENIRTLFVLCRYYKLVLTAVCYNHQNVCDFKELIGLSKHLVQLPIVEQLPTYYIEREVLADIFTEEEKEFITMQLGNTEDIHLIYKKAIDIGKIETFLVSCKRRYQDAE